MANNDSFSTIPTISSNAAAGTTAAPTTGFVDLTGGARNITTTGLALVSLDITSALQGSGSSGIVKLGAGGLRLSSTGNSYAGATTLTLGTLFLGASNVIPDFSTFSMATGSTLDINGVNEAISQLSGAGVITNNGGSTTLTVGLNSANTAFAGQFNAYSATTLSNFNLAKVGGGTLTLTGSGSTSTGTLTVNKGTVAYSGGGQTAFGTQVINQTGTLLIDNSSGNLNNRLGGGGLLKNITIAGGELKIIGASGAGSYESLGTVNAPSGTGIITLVASGSTVLNLNSMHVLSTGSTYLVRGSNLGATPGAGVANVLATTIAFTGGNAIAGLANISTRPDMIGDATATGNGTGFLTYTAGDEAQGKLTSTGYVPISGDLLTKVRKAVASIA